MNIGIISWLLTICMIRGTQNMVPNIQLIQVPITDTETILVMYKAAFKQLFMKYHDVNTSPYLEQKSNLVKKMRDPRSTYYYIKTSKHVVGLVRVIVSDSGQEARISPLSILPEFQGNGFGRSTLLQLEGLYSRVKIWSVDTIVQEQHLLAFYTHCGYQTTHESVYHIQPGMDLVQLVKKA